MTNRTKQNIKITKIDLCILHKTIKANVSDKYWCGRKLVYEALKYNILALLYLKNQTHENGLAIVKYDGFLLDIVENPTLEICTAAVNQTRYALEFVNDEFKYLFNK